jgi:hypothetical protein
VVTRSGDTLAAPLATEKVTSVFASGVPLAFLTSAVTVPGVDALMVVLDSDSTTVPDALVDTVPESDVVVPPVVVVPVPVVVVQLAEKTLQPASAPPPPHALKAAASASPPTRQIILFIAITSVGFRFSGPPHCGR